MFDERRFDILSPEFHANPFTTLDRMRTEGPVVRLRLPIVAAPGSRRATRAAQTC
ncbi:hypothetical protein ABIC03_001538 [Bradyrhizobium sp. RT6a]